MKNLIVTSRECTRKWVRYIKDSRGVFRTGRTSKIELFEQKLNKNFDNFKRFLSDLKFSFKIICLSETWITSDRNISIDMSMEIITKGVTLTNNSLNKSNDYYLFHLSQNARVRPICKDVSIHYLWNKLS